MDSPRYHPYTLDNPPPRSPGGTDGKVAGLTPIAGYRCQDTVESGNHRRVRKALRVVCVRCILGETQSKKQSELLT